MAKRKKQTQHVYQTIVIEDSSEINLKEHLDLLFDRVSIYHGKLSFTDFLENVRIEFPTKIQDIFNNKNCEIVYSATVEI